MRLPQDVEPGTSGVSENQNVPLAATWKRVVAEQDGGHLAGRLAVVAADADDGVARHRGEDLVDLEAQRLLQADEIGVLRPEQREEHVAPLAPVVLAVVGGAVADVEGHHRDRLRSGRRRRSAMAAEPSWPRPATDRKSATAAADTADAAKQAPTAESRCRDAHAGGHYTTGRTRFAGGGAAGSWR